MASGYIPVAGTGQTHGGGTLARRSLAVAFAAGLFLALLPAAPSGVAPHVCDPHPIGRCGDYQRESVVHCFQAGKPPKVYLSPTETNVITLGWGPAFGGGVPNPAGPPHVLSQDTGAMGAYYLWKDPLDTLVADPYEAPLPQRWVFEESNSFAGLQRVAFVCATFQWFAECEPAQWELVTNPSRAEADLVVA